MFFMFAIILLLFGAINAYIGVRGWQAFHSLFPLGFNKIYWAILIFLAASFFIYRLGEKIWPAYIGSFLNYLSVYWLIIMFYGFLILLIVDILRLVNRWIPFIPKFLMQEPIWAGTGVVLLLVVIMVYGTWNAQHPVLRSYTVDIAKPIEAAQKQVKVIMVSDVHLGGIVHKERLSRLVEDINHHNPDIVLIPGDLIDGEVRPIIEQNMVQILQQLHPTLGTYAVLGNHEYMGGHLDEILKELEHAGITVLRDQQLYIAEHFYLVGRDDPSADRYGQKRQDLAAIMQDVDNSRPIILLDHQPFHLEEAQAAGVDLQLSGHTHRGQLFPNQLITQRMYEIDWGYLKKETLQVIVSCGYGTWGPPIRIGNRPELVEITLNFGDYPKE